MAAVMFLVGTRPRRAVVVPLPSDPAQHEAAIARVQAVFTDAARAEVRWEVVEADDVMAVDVTDPR